LNELTIIVIVSIALLSPLFINEAFAFTGQNNTFGFTASSHDGRVVNTVSATGQCPTTGFSLFESSIIVEIDDTGATGFCMRSWAEFDVSSISNFTNVVTAIQLRIDVSIDFGDTRVCDFNSLEIQPSVGLTPDPAKDVWDDIGDGTNFLTNVGNPFCDDPPVVNDVVLDLGSFAVADMNDAFDINQSWWGTGWKYTDETRVAGTNKVIQYVNDSVEILINYTSITDTDPPVIIITGNDPASILLGQTYVDAGATATDDFDVDSANIVSVSNVNTSTLGTFQVTYNVNDRVGNSATEAVRTVNVVEQGATITGGGGVGQSSPLGGGIASSVPSLSDIPPLSVVPIEPIEKPPRRTLDEIFDRFAQLFEEDKALFPTLEVTEPISATKLPPPIAPQPTEVRLSFIESIQNFFANLFG